MGRRDPTTVTLLRPLHQANWSSLSTMMLWKKISIAIKCRSCNTTDASLTEKEVETSLGQI